MSDHLNSITSNFNDIHLLTIASVATMVMYRLGRSSASSRKARDWSDIVVDLMVIFPFSFLSSTLIGVIEGSLLSFTYPVVKNMYPTVYSFGLQLHHMILPSYLLANVAFDKFRGK